MSEHVQSFVSAEGEHAMAEQDLCIAIGQDLQRHFPGYPWMVGVNIESGTLVIDLPPDWKPIKYRQWGILLHLQSLSGAGAQRKVMHAGGEMLERMGLPRSAAPKDAQMRALEHGIDASNAVIKSKGSTI